MTTRIHHITFDADDALALGAFWSQLTGWNLYHDDDPEVLVSASFPHPGPGPVLLFIPVPEGKTAKNRIHFDLIPTDCTREEQLERAIELGATLQEDHREENGSGWVVMTDPEGNEFCIERGDSERAPAKPGVYRIGTD